MPFYILTYLMFKKNKIVPFNNNFVYNPEIIKIINKKIINKSIPTKKKYKYETKSTLQIF
jgi:hypothetical protein